MKKDYIPLFRIISTHGLKGDLKVTLLTSNEELLDHLKELYLLKPEIRPLTVKKLRKGPGYMVYLLTLEGVTYEEAESLVGEFLYTRISDLPQLEEGEFYYHQLEGLRILDEKESERGVVIGVIPMGDYELLIIRTREGEEFYLPLVEDYVESIDLERGVIKVKSVEELFEVQR